MTLGQALSSSDIMTGCTMFQWCFIRPKADTTALLPAGSPEQNPIVSTKSMLFFVLFLFCTKHLLKCVYLIYQLKPHGLQFMSCSHRMVGSMQIGFYSALQGTLKAASGSTIKKQKTKNTRRQLWLISAGSIFWEGLFDISASRWAYVCVQTIAKMKKAWGNGIAPTLYSALDCLGTVLEKWALRGISCCFRVPITFRPILSWFCRDENIKL